MSVRAWKRVITFFVIGTILFLAFKVVALTNECNALSSSFDEALHNEFIVDLSEYEHLDQDELETLFNYLGNLDTNQTLEYQTRYSDLYVDNDFEFVDRSDEKICYLTFDDGPDAENTARVLDILKEYDVKATFFVVYKDFKDERDLYKRIVEEGHSIGVHTASHNYNKIYASVDAYLDDFQRCSEQIESVTGVKPEIFRFPGGSVNSYNSHIYQEIIAEMIRRGYTYYDWNSSGGDAASSYVSEQRIAENVLNTGQKINNKFVLLHDGTGHNTTADALPQIIEGLIEQGYKLEAITNDVEPVCFGYYQ